MFTPIPCSDGIGCPGKMSEGWGRYGLMRGSNRVDRSAMGLWLSFGISFMSVGLSVPATGYRLLPKLSLLMGVIMGHAITP